MTTTNELLWHVAHTLPRCEKKLTQFCEREGIAATLPCYKAPHKYRRKTVVFEKPLFPGYVFLRMPTTLKGKIVRSDYVANLLDVIDQQLLESQLDDVLLALDTQVEIRLAPAIGKGTRVKIKRGALEGVEGWVEDRYGMCTVLLRIDFIGQAAAVKVEATDLEVIG